MKYIKILMVLCVILSFFSIKAGAQNTSGITVEATIYDQDGKQIANATIAGDDGKIVQHSDASGHFTIVVPANSTLVIHAKGFKTQIVNAVSGLEKISLISDNGGHVNVAFNTIERNDLPGAISVVNPGEYLNKDYLTSVPDGMYGRVGGLLGNTNIWGMNNALIMIDGVPRSYEDIKLSEVEQITVLKGVNAVALYGSYAAKGVILITTKRGEAHNRKINVRVNRGLGFPKVYPKYLGSAEYMTLYNEARINDGLTAQYDSTLINNYRNGNKYRYPDVDYYSSDYLSKSLNTTDAITEFSGGNDKASFYTNMGWMYSNSLLKVGQGKDNANNRVNLRGNIDLKLNNFISATVDVSAIIYNNRSDRSNYWSNASTMLPFRFSPLVPIDLIPASDSVSIQTANLSKNIIDGKYLLGGAQEILTNPVADLYGAGYNKFVRRDFQVTNGIDVNLNSLLTGLSFHTKFHLDYNNAYNQFVNYTYAIYYPTWSLVSDTITGITKYNSDSHNLSQNVSGTLGKRNLGYSVQLNYIKSINDVHNISVILLGAANSINMNSVFQLSTNTNIGLQGSYNYKHKYWIDFSGAFVNSTKLAENHRTAFSPTIGLGWLISDEGFLAGSGLISRLKLFASAGILNTDLDINNYYMYENTYASTSWFSWRDNLSSNSNQAFKSTNGANTNLSFIKRKEFNISMDGSFLKDLINIQATYFAMEVSGFPTQRFTQYPSYFRDNVPYINYNSNRYNGFDVLLNLNKRIGAFELDLGMSATYADSKVAKKDELYQDSYQNRTGKPVDAIFGLVSSGFFADQTDITTSPLQAFGEVKAGDIKYVDQNNDNIIDSKDEVFIGRWGSPYSLGLNFSVSYKNFSIFIQGTGYLGGTGVKTSDYFWVDYNDKYSEVVRGRWTPGTSSTAEFPRLSSLSNTNNFRYSDFWTYSTNRFDISQIQLTYNLPGNILKKTFVKEFSIYLSGYNLYTFAANKKIMDLNIGGQPYLRYSNLGITANF